MARDVEQPTVEYLRDLAERLMRVPVMYGTDQSDCDELYTIAKNVEALLIAALSAVVALKRINQRVYYGDEEDGTDHGNFVTALDARQIEEIGLDAAGELVQLETAIRAALPA